MPITFLTLPSEIRNSIYEILVVKESRIDGRWALYKESGENGLAPGILAVNREVHRDTAPMLYARNCFDFSSIWDHYELVAFFEGIGEVNTNRIRRVFFPFPRLEVMKHTSITVVGRWFSTLATVGRYCGRLSTVELSFKLSGARGDRRALFGFADPHRIIKQVMGSMNARFKALPSQPEIIVEASKEAWDSHFLLQMQRHGWTVKIVGLSDTGGMLIVPFDDYVASRATGEHQTLSQGQSV